MSAVYTCNSGAGEDGKVAVSCLESSDEQVRLKPSFCFSMVFRFLPVLHCTCTVNDIVNLRCYWELNKLWK